MDPPPSTGLTDLGLSYSVLHTFAAAVQGVVAALVSVAVPSPSLSAPTGKVVTLSLLNHCFAYRWQWMGNSLPFGRRSPEGKGGWRG